MSSTSGYCGILLAAGRSQRFGTDKLMHPLAADLPMACVSAAHLQCVLPHTLAVVRPDQFSLIKQFAAQGIQTVTLAQTDGGMGLSIAAGIAATHSACGWLIALADMPFIQSETIAQVLASLQCGSAITAPLYQGRRGHPVGFSAAFGESLRALHGDIGARDLLMQHRNKIKLITCDDPGVLADIDTPADLLTNNSIGS
ncbi:MAG: nucleotidyltransferase family protein [Rugosibacter sp.]|jgi:molybdenum cofactor cytidylyltransferase|nr:nucleotidyltransferase family protein [Rugosibacter sp.]